MTTKNISQSGYRILMILNILINKGVSRNEIIELLKNDKIINKKLSDDTITLYVNTLRENGFDISRPNKHNGYEYTVKNDIPFLKLKNTSIEHLQQVKKLASENGDWLFVLKFNDLMQSILKFVSPPNRLQFEQKLLNSQPFGYKENAKILELYKIVQNSDSVEINYNSPNSGMKLFEVRALNLSLENNKVYLWCENLIDYNIHYLRIDRILDFKKMTIKSTVKNLPTKVTYKLKGQEAFLFNLINEKIISKNESEIIIETEIQNEFWFVQKIMSYGNDCTIVEPLSFKDKIVEKILKIQELYKC
jgi:predicted DNA-binding transcriptional regulator YafY